METGDSPTQMAAAKAASVATSKEAETMPKPARLLVPSVSAADALSNVRALRASMMNKEKIAKKERVSAASRLGMGGGHPRRTVLFPRYYFEFDLLGIES